MKPTVGIITAVLLSAALCAAQTESKTTPPAAPANTNTFIIGPLDVLDIRVWDNPKLSGFYDVRPDGIISMPLIGELKADGLTIAEFARLVKEKLSTQINDPDVNIQPSRINSQKVYVLGEVNRQGEMPLTGNMTVLDAISNSGGFKDFSNPKKITIMRGTKQFKFNYKDVSKGRHMEQNIPLQSGDHIFVPE
jgi:polysaccharide export outer membrane protein